jgi:hypothetical protein
MWKECHGTMMLLFLNQTHDVYDSFVILAFIDLSAGYKFLVGTYL